MERWRATDKRREGGGRLESGVHGYKGVAGRKVNRTGESFVPVTSWWNVSRNFCSGNWRSIVMQEVACRTRKTEGTFSNSFLSLPLRLCSRGKLYVLRSTPIWIHELLLPYSCIRIDASSARGMGRNKDLADFSVLEIGDDGSSGPSSRTTNIWISIYT